jgi:hypothetical protein
VIAAIFFTAKARINDAATPATKPHITAGRWYLALTLSKYVKTNIAINKTSNPSRKRIKKELK